MFSFTFLTFLTLNIQKAVFSLTFLTFLTFGGLCAIRRGWAWVPAPQIAKGPPNFKNDKNVDENKVVWRFEVKNVKNVNENTAFWQVDYEMYWFY